MLRALLRTILPIPVIPHNPSSDKWVSYKIAITKRHLRVRTGLHLKSSVNYVGRNTMLLTREFADIDEIRSYDKIITEKGEEHASNTLLINDTLIMPKGFPGVRKKLDTLDLEIIELDVSEAAWRRNSELRTTDSLELLAWEHTKTIWKIVLQKMKV